MIKNFFPKISQLMR